MQTMPRPGFPVSLEQFRSHLEGVQLTSLGSFIVVFKALPPLIVVDGKPLTIIEVEGGTITPRYSWESQVEPERRRMCQALKIALAMSGNTTNSERLLSQFALLGKRVIISFNGFA